MVSTSVAQQQLMLNLDLNSQLLQGTFSNISKINSQNKISNFTVNKNSGKLAYAVEGNIKYKEEIDSDSNGIITYNEYVKYIADTISNKYNFLEAKTIYSKEDSQSGFQKFTVTDMRKVLISYINNYATLPESKIEQEA